MAASVQQARLPEADKQAEAFGRTRSDHRNEIAEDYVELIADLIDATGEARAVDLANRLGVTNATVTNAITRLQREGLVRSEPYRSIFLTQDGPRPRRALPTPPPHRLPLPPLAGCRRGRGARRCRRHRASRQRRDLWPPSTGCCASGMGEAASAVGLVVAVAFQLTSRPIARHALRPSVRVSSAGSLSTRGPPGAGSFAHADQQPAA